MRFTALLEIRVEPVGLDDRSLEVVDTSVLGTPPKCRKAHHVYNLDTLREAYFRLKRDAAPGVDGQTWKAYGEALEENLRRLQGCDLRSGRPGRRLRGGF